MASQPMWWKILRPDTWSCRQVPLSWVTTAFATSMFDKMKVQYQFCTRWWSSRLSIKTGMISQLNTLTCILAATTPIKSQWILKQPLKTSSYLTGCCQGLIWSSLYRNLGRSHMIGIRAITWMHCTIIVRSRCWSSSWAWQCWRTTSSMLTAPSCPSWVKRSASFSLRLR
jgi:hypothetical protein